MKMNVEDRNCTREETNVLFWIERLFLLLLVIFPTYLLDFFVLIIFLTTIVTIPFFFVCPNLSSVGSSGIGGIWLFLLDRFTFYLAFQYFKLMTGGFELAFLWHLTFLLSIVIHSVYIVEHLLGSVPLSPSHGDVSKHLEQMKELLEDGKKMIQSMEHMMHSGLDAHRKEWGEFLDDLRKEEKTKMTQVDTMICSQLGTLRDNIRLKVDNICQELRDELRSKVDKDITASTQDIKSVADQLNKTYLASQETVRDTRSHDYEAFLIDQNKRGVIRGEDVEGFVELREQVRRMAIEAEIAAEELSRTTVALVEAGIQQWEEDNADYLASLPLLYLNRN